MSKISLLANKIHGRFFRNTGWLLFERIFQLVISLFVTALMGRYLGTERYGLLNYGLAYVTIFTTVCKLGIDSIIVNEIIKTRQKTGELLGTTILLRFVSAILSIGVIYLVVYILNPDDKILQMVTVIQSFSLLFVSVDTVAYWFQSNLESKYAVISKSIAFAVVSAWRLVLIWLQAPLIYFAVATIIEALVMGIFLLIFYYRFHGQKLKFRRATTKRLLTISQHFIFSSLLVMIYTQMDRIMLGQLAGNSAVGIYTAAMTIASLWVFIPYALIDSARPIILTAKEKDNGLYERRLKQLYCAVFWISVGASIFFSLLGKPLVHILYGKAYLAAVPVLSTLIWSRLFSLMGVIRDIWLIGEKHYRYVKYFVGCGALINVALNMLLIPQIGALGAAVATLFTEFIASILVTAIPKKTRPLVALIFKAIIFK